MSNRVCKRKPMALASSSRGYAFVVPVKGDENETRLNGVIYPRCALPHMQLSVYEHDGRLGSGPEIGNLLILLTCTGLVRFQ